MMYHSSQPLDVYQDSRRVESVQYSLYIEVKKVNPFTPNSDLKLISPYRITTESHIKVMRIKEIIALRSLWLLNKFSLSVW